MKIIEPIVHRGERRLRVDIPYSPENQQRIKSVPGRQWSQSLRCWHVPYTQDAYDMVRALFGNETGATPAAAHIQANGSVAHPIDTNHPQTPTTPPPAGANTLPHQPAAPPGASPPAPAPLAHGEKKNAASDRMNLPFFPKNIGSAAVASSPLAGNSAPGGAPAGGSVRLQIVGKNILVYLPEHPADTQFLTSLKYYKWRKAEKCWQIPHYKDNLQVLKQYFGQRIAAIDEVQQSVPTPTPPQPDTWECLHTTQGRVVVKALYFAPLVAWLKQQPYR